MQLSAVTVYFFGIHSVSDCIQIYVIKEDIVEEKVVVIHRGRCNNKVYYRLSHGVVTEM